jgi:hypothetical protein
MTWVTDLSHFIDARTGQLPTNVPGPARRLMEHQTRIVVAATRAADGHKRATEGTEPIKCRRRPGHRLCPGVIKHQVWADQRIGWRCSSCGDNGIISNWQSTPWDRRRVRPAH